MDEKARLTVHEIQTCEEKKIWLLGRIDQKNEREEESKSYSNLYRVCQAHILSPVATIKIYTYEKRYIGSKFNSYKEDELEFKTISQIVHMNIYIYTHTYMVSMISKDIEDLKKTN